MVATKTPAESTAGRAGTGPTSPRGFVVGAALAAVYLIWGSTYLAIRFGLEGFPPFLLSAIRFLVAGVIMYTVLRIRGTPAPSRRHWWNAAIVGALMLAGGVGLVTIAEDFGVGSGVAATAVASYSLSFARRHLYFSSIVEHSPTPSPRRMPVFWWVPRHVTR